MFGRFGSYLWLISYSNPLYFLPFAPQQVTPDPVCAACQGRQARVACADYMPADGADMEYG